KGEKLPAKPIVITFDDGYQDNYTYAWPILRKYRFTATVFVVTNTIGGINKFDCIKHIEPKNKMMNWAQIREMNANGIIIGSHTLDHLHLTHISYAEAKRQIAESKEVLQHGLGKEVQYFCYPYGDVSPSIAKLVQESGYKAATAINPGAAYRRNPYMLARIRVTGHYSHQRFIANLNRYK
ncbi:MAG TPA: polysaccharide deacetylase family protein, partial [Syntrophomonadaceae bacterium]|nr:polysaccharide deacetylase family protein [Syntrophomonadaceae bacterium]